MDNTANLFDDALVTVKVKTGSGASAGAKGFNVYAFGSTDGGTVYSENAGGSDAAITLTSPTGLVKIGFIPAPTAATTYVSAQMSVAAAFFGSLPAFWGIVVENQQGQTADSTGGNFSATWQGIYGTYT